MNRIRRLYITPDGDVTEEGKDNGSTPGTLLAYDHRTGGAVVKWPGRSVYGGQLGHRTYAPVSHRVYQVDQYQVETTGLGDKRHVLVCRPLVEWDRDTEPRLPAFREGRPPQ